MPKKPELEAEAEAALAAGGDAQATPPEGQVAITNENALIVMAQAMVAIEKHLFALVYIENTKDPEKTGFTYVPDVFKAIYDGGDPFQEVRDAQAQAEADGKSDA
jgi:hypothetical protein